MNRVRLGERQALPNDLRMTWKGPEYQRYCCDR